MPNTVRKKAGSAATRLDLLRLNPGAVQIEGDRVTVRISRNSHPELYDIDKLIRAMRALIENYSENRVMRDFVTFLAETEKGLQIILRNHLELAMRQYLGRRPV